MEFVVEPITVIGYHGTSTQLARKIISEGFKASQNPWDWLGHGAYFWQDAPKRAFQWAKERHRDPCVVAARIELSGFIDLLDLEGMETLKSVAAGYQLHAGNTRPANLNKMNRLDCAIFNLTTSMLSLDDVLVSGYRAACVEGKPLTIGSPIHDESHVQIVVLDEDAITQRWIVETREKG